MYCCSILSMEFMHVARHATNGGNNLDLLIQQGIKSRPDNVINGLDDEVCNSFHHLILLIFKLIQECL